MYVVGVWAFVGGRRWWVGFVCVCVCVCVYVCVCVCGVCVLFICFYDILHTMHT